MSNGDGNVCWELTDEFGEEGGDADKVDNDG